MRSFALENLIFFLLLLFFVLVLYMFRLLCSLILWLLLSCSLLLCMSPLLCLESFLVLWLNLAHSLQLYYLILTMRLFLIGSSLRRLLLLGTLIFVKLLFCENLLHLAIPVSFENFVTWWESASLMFLVIGF